MKKPERFVSGNPPYDWRIVSANLRAVRLGHHLKQREAAEALGVDKRTLINYEKGDGCPDWGILSKILTFCPGNPSGLFYRTLYPEIQASPSFRKRGTLPFFSVLLGLLVGAAVTAAIMTPFLMRPSPSSSTSSGSVPYHGDL
jgi:DNA-binding XRE family transcriptional regulator